MSFCYPASAFIHWVQPLPVSKLVSGAQEQLNNEHQAQRVGLLLFRHKIHDSIMGCCFLWLSGQPRYLTYRNLEYNVVCVVIVTAFSTVWTLEWDKNTAPFKNIYIYILPRCKWPQCNMVFLKKINKWALIFVVLLHFLMSPFRLC